MIKVAFVCIHNSCRSQMAEGYLKTLGNSLFEVYSAGTESYPEVKPKAVEAMKLDGVDIRKQTPKTLEVLPDELDLLVTMGCGVACPYVPTKEREDWALEDPSGGPLEGFIVTRDLIKEKVIELVERYKKSA